MKRKSKFEVNLLDLRSLAEVAFHACKSVPGTDDLVGLMPNGRTGYVNININTSTTSKSSSYYLINNSGHCSFFPITYLSPGIVNFYPLFSDESFQPVVIYSAALRVAELEELKTGETENLADFVLRYGYNSEGEFARLNAFFNTVSAYSRQLNPQNDSEKSIIKCSEDLIKFGSYLTPNKCLCNTFIELLSVSKNICPCGMSEGHSHCRNCGGIPLRSGKPKI